MSSNYHLRRDVVQAVADEMNAQDEKWGQQDHPDGTGDQYAGVARWRKIITDEAAKEGTLTWRDVLLEEVCEALAESEPVALENELVQVAAVALQWVQASRRRREQT